VENGVRPEIFVIGRLLIDLIFGVLTFSSISAISWRPVLVVEEAGKNHRPWAKQLLNFITCGCVSSTPIFVIYQAGRESTPYW
jgi:formate/nitrite transporter FocA (FNT family)